MTRSSPSRRSQMLSSPDRQSTPDFLHPNRNSEFSHRDALAAAQAEHERVRDAAIKVFQLHEMQEEHQRIVEANEREQERLRYEAQIAAEEKRLQELRAKSIPKPTPPPEPPKQPEPAPPPPALASPPASTKAPTPIAQEARRAEPSPAPRPDLNGTPTPAAQAKNPFATQSKPPQSNPFSSPPPPVQPQAQKTPAAQPNGIATSQPAAPISKPTVTQGQPALSSASTRLMQIHQALKKLRADLQTEAKRPGSPLKGQLGDFRRTIRVAIGQLTSGKGANKLPIEKITTTLKASLDGRVPSPPVDVSLYVVDQRQPMDGAPNNDATLPALFIYLMNICAKGIIAQFINEAGANTKAADPVGVFTAHIFSTKEFQWRGQSLIDILMAKFRVVCPVLFGSRGIDTKERGRLALGWKRDEGGGWITEQQHNDRMTGLGAGFASISLRDFHRTTKTNPYPPTNYWKALATMVNTPASETSNTQYVVLRSMIDGYEQRFINFYGNAAVAALRLALIEFPKKAPANSSASGSLQALAEVLRSEWGLSLA